MWINPQLKVVHNKLPAWGSNWMRHVYVSFWPLRLHPRQAGYVSGMLAPVGIGITGALLIVGALYSIRMIHRKRRNSFKHQRRKVRQPEVNTLFVFITCFSSFACYWGSVFYWVLYISSPATSRSWDQPSGPGHAAGWQLWGWVLIRPFLATYVCDQWLMLL